MIYLYIYSLHTLSLIYLLDLFLGLLFSFHLVIVYMQNIVFCMLILLLHYKLIFYVTVLSYNLHAIQFTN